MKTIVSRRRFARAPGEGALSDIQEFTPYYHSIYNDPHNAITTIGVLADRAEELDSPLAPLYRSIFDKQGDYKASGAGAHDTNSYYGTHGNHHSYWFPTGPTDQYGYTPQSIVQHTFRPLKDGSVLISANFVPKDTSSQTKGVLYGNITREQAEAALTHLHAIRSDGSYSTNLSGESLDNFRTDDPAASFRTHYEAVTGSLVPRQLSRRTFARLHSKTLEAFVRSGLDSDMSNPLDSHDGVLADALEEADDPRHMIVRQDLQHRVGIGKSFRKFWNNLWAHARSLGYKGQDAAPDRESDDYDLNDKTRLSVYTIREPGGVNLYRYIWEVPRARYDAIFNEEDHHRIMQGLGLENPPEDPQLLARRKFSRASDEQAFHNAIHKDPRDKTNALVYADWLEENGRPTMAEVIRNHIEEHGWVDQLSKMGGAYILGDHVPPGGVHFAYGMMRDREGTMRNGPYVTQRSVSDPDKYFSWYYPEGSDEVGITPELRRVANGLKSEGAEVHLSVTGGHIHPKDEPYGPSGSGGNWTGDPDEDRVRRRYAAYRAPAGGMVVRGTAYRGGELIPNMKGKFMNPPKRKPKKKPSTTLENKATAREKSRLSSSSPP